MFDTNITTVSQLDDSVGAIIENTAFYSSLKVAVGSLVALELVVQRNAHADTPQLHVTISSHIAVAFLEQSVICGFVHRASIVVNAQHRAILF